MNEVAMTPSWPEYLAQLDEYLEELRRALTVGFASPPRTPERPSSPVPEECVARVARLHLECEELMVQMSDHMAELERRAAVTPLSPHGGRSASYIETDI